MIQVFLLDVHAKDLGLGKPAPQIERILSQAGAGVQDALRAETLPTQLRQAACKPPADNPTYHAEYIALPPTGDGLRTAFSATVVLQQLALAMSVRKAAWLDALHLAGHGVHPDVPKNVSKSITVD